MITKLTEENLNDFKLASTYQPIFGAKNMASLRCYGMNSNEAAFYVIYSENKPTASVCIQHNVAAISSDANIKTEDLIQLIKLENLKELEGSVEDIDRLNAQIGGEKDSSWFMEYLAANCPAPAVELRKCTDLRETFDVLQKSHKFYQDHYTFETWSEDVAKRVEHNECEEYVLEIEGRIIGCGSVGAYDDKVATVSAIAVIPEERNQGYGSAITLFLVRRILEMGLKPVLIAGYDEVSELYLELGFTRCGKWGELYV